eukprot:TRINITY_DN13737_c0_g1_i1.p1 TRINITY_DN13737_c0_g1~~TRINITY_DN13737_c0_g1_i1.p1  ORF type:complete len:233 (+),score=82.61 TRINITY_DN13737_c0_g1_i1:42-740(+)
MGSSDGEPPREPEDGGEVAAVGLEEEDEETLFVQSNTWTGPRKGFYYGTGDQGLGYYPDRPLGSYTVTAKDGTKTLITRDAEEETFERVKEEKAPAAAGPAISNKLRKKLLAMTPEQRVLMGYGNVSLDKRPPPQQGGAAPPRGVGEKAKYSDLDKDVMNTIKAQKRKAAADPTGKERYSYQKHNPHFGDSNQQKQDIFMLFKNDKSKARRIASREDRQKAAYTKQNKPSWL